ncbi:MAG: hypothetical protein ACOC6D_06220 [Atribacterota bacterium]
MEPTLKEYLGELEKRYQGHYNVETYKAIVGKQVDIYAISIIEHFRHVLSKKIQIDHYQEREIILVKGFDQFIQAEEIKEFSQYLVTISKELITPSFEVMSHTINGIMVSSQGFSKEATEAARKFKYGRTFCLGIKGWCDIRLLLIDIKNSSVFCNAKGKEIAEVYTFREKRGDKKQPIKK